MTNPLAKKKRSSESNALLSTSATSATSSITISNINPNNIHNTSSSSCSSSKNHRISERITTMDLPMVSSMIMAAATATATTKESIKKNKSLVHDFNNNHNSSNSNSNNNNNNHDSSIPLTKQVQLADATRKFVHHLNLSFEEHGTTILDKYLTPQEHDTTTTATTTTATTATNNSTTLRSNEKEKFHQVTFSSALAGWIHKDSHSHKDSTTTIMDNVHNHPQQQEEEKDKKVPEDDPSDDQEDEDDDNEEEDADDDEDLPPVVGLCLHCGMSPPSSVTITGPMTSTLGSVVPCSSTTNTNTNPTHNPNSHKADNHYFPIQDYNHHQSNNIDADTTQAIPDTTTNTNTTATTTQTAVGIQVSCDECHSFICTSCHWCHEYQANHEIRVCDRCDAFYCKVCDEMDQCEDCGEVVCEGCGALCSCKFCGCGLCEDCATACGRCGIVLCSRDAKFAVECDTCKMSYCLVCLASGTKDPCVRCGHRTSKRVEQLVHLRLKSIYKAFKQSTSMKIHNHEIKSISDKHQGNISARDIPSDKECVGAVLQVAAAAAAAASSMQSSKSTSSSYTLGNLDASALHETMRDLSVSGMNPTRINLSNPNIFSPPKPSKKNPSDEFAAKTTAEADAAAAALLAELDEEMLNAEASSKSKKSKKKKKKEKEKQTAKEKEESLKKDTEKKETDKIKAQNNHQEEEQKRSSAISGAISNKDNIKSIDTSKTSTKKVIHHISKPEELPDDSEEDETKSNAVLSSALPPVDDDNDIEIRLALAISSNDINGIEEILGELKGIPGRATLRKNAKKALKKIKEDREDQEAAILEQRSKDERDLALSLHSALGVGGGKNGATEFKPTDPLVTTVSTTHRLQSSAGPARYERVLSMAPSVVGWVIGKGGQRIRDLMEESGAKVWIDQESMGPNDRRIVYVSGSKKSVDAAVRTIKDLVNTAPTGSTYNPGSATVTTVASTGGVPNNLTVPEFEDIVSTRSSLTSTPISMANSSQQATLSSQKQYATSPRKDLLPQSDIYNVLPPISLPPAAASTGERSVPPPPGMSTMRNPSSSLLKVEDIRKEIVCEKRFVPLLIGRRGWTVKHIQDTSGARVDIDQNVDPPLIIISGVLAQVHEAERQVQEILNYPHAQSNYSEGSAEDDTHMGIGVLGVNGPRSENVLPNMQPSCAPKVNDMPTVFFDDRLFLKSAPMLPQVQSPFAYTQGNSNSSKLFDNLSINSYQQQHQHHQSSNNTFGLFDNHSQSLNHSMAGSAFGNPRHDDQFYVRQNLPNSFTNQYSERPSLRHNFDYEEILPLNMNSSSHHNQFDRFGPSSTNTTFGRHLFPPGRPEYDEVSDEYNIVDTLFSGPYGESQMSGFQNTPAGTTETRISFDWASLGNQNVNESDPPRRSVGLGGVRLDLSQDTAPNNNANHENNQRQSYGM